MGEWYIYGPAIVLFLVFSKTRTAVGIPMAIIVLTSVILSVVLKQVFTIPRPDVYRMVYVSWYGFPSGHVMNGTAFVGTLAVLFLSFDFSKALKTMALIATTAFIILMGLSRVYLGVHTMTDAVAGFFSGVFVIAAYFAVMHWREGKKSSLSLPQAIQ